MGAQGSILKPITFLFRSFKRVLAGYNLENVFRMSSRSGSHHGNVVVSLSERPAVSTHTERSGGEISGYEEVLKQHEAVEKLLGPISENVRNKVWMSPDLQIYSNSEYVYGKFPIALSIFWGKGGEEICL